MRRALSFGTASLASIAGLAAAVNAASLQPVLVDSMGKTLGPILQQGEVLLTFPGKQYRQAVVFSTGFGLAKDTTQPVLYYKSAVCSGNAYLPATPVPGNAYVLVDNDTFTYAGATAANVTYNSTSYLFHCARQSGSAYLAPARTISISSLGFTPPFAASLQ